MAFFVWNDALSVGDTAIDNDHRKLIKLVDDLYGALEQGRSKDVLGKTLDELIAHTGMHFKREEEMMQQADYSGRSGHEYEHTKLLREMLDLQKKFAAGDAVLTIQVSQFLREWLFDHIQHLDRTMVEAIRSAR